MSDPNVELAARQKRMDDAMERVFAPRRPGIQVYRLTPDVDKNIRIVIGKPNRSWSFTPK